MELITIIALATILVLLYKLIKWKYSYWERRGVPFIKPNIPLGNAFPIGSKYHVSEIFNNFYNQMKGKGKFFGLYAFQSPVVIATDIDLIKNILIKDFNNFVDRGFYHNEKDDPLSGHLFAIEGQRWRSLRTKLSPTFTSGKMKFMYPTMLDVAKEFKSTVDTILKLNNGSADIEMKDILARFTTDVIGVCAFGIQCNSLKDPDTEFREMGKNIFTVQKSRLPKFFFATAFPSFSKVIGLKITKSKVEKFFMDIVRQTVNFRKENKANRNDFMELLIKLLNEKDGISMNELSAQAFIFFIAGFETSSTAMTFAFHELAKNPDIQEKARKEIEAILEKHNGEFTYEAMMQMTYIEQIINESLRKYPPVTRLTRTVTETYKVPGTDFELEKGTKVFIPLYSIQHDEEYYPNPEEFNPDRFSPEEQQKRDSITFLPFGDGPRHCIGLRFGMMQAKVGLVTLLRNYQFSFCEKSVVPLKISKRSFILTSEGGVYLNFKSVN